MKACIACAENIQDAAKLCKHCGTKQDDPSFASPNDGSAFPPAGFDITPIGVVEDRTQKTVRASTKAVLRGRLLVAVIAVATLILGGGATWFWIGSQPKATVFSLELTSEDDFTFTSDCVPQTKEDQSLEKVVQIALYNMAALEVPANRATLVALPGKWLFGESGACRFEASIVVPDDADTYNLKFEGIHGDYPLAEQQTIQSGVEEVAITGDVTYFEEIVGNLSLWVNVSEKQLNNCINNMVFLFGGTCGQLDYPEWDKCNGGRGFDDLAEGTVVRVLTDENVEIGLGRLSKGEGPVMLGATKEWINLGGSKWYGACEFRWSVEVPRVEGNYVVKVAENRGEKAITLDELDSLGWKVDLTIGDAPDFS